MADVNADNATRQNERPVNSTRDVAGDILLLLALIGIIAFSVCLVTGRLEAFLWIYPITFLLMVLERIVRRK